MLKKIICAFSFLVVNFLSAQETRIHVDPNPNDSRVITTAVPFLQIASDPRAAGMGDMGVATSVDAFSQSWNSSKYAFSENKSGFGLSYTPYLSSLVNDIFLGNFNYYNRFNERSAFGASLRYFSLGDVELLEDPDSVPLIVNPSEFTIDVSYALRMSRQYSMGVGLRYVNSNLKIDQENDTSAKGTVAVDINGFYLSDEKMFDSFNGRYRFGYAIQNLGPKLKYDDSDPEGDFLPTTLRLGAGFDFIFDSYNTLKVTGEVTKLLVPTPPILGDEYEYLDLNGNGVYDEDSEELTGPVKEDIIYKGKDDNVPFFEGVFQSFADAPGGFSEEMREFTWALGAEYVYQDSFAFRAGYFNEAEDKGAREFLSLGAGFKYTTINIDLSYLFSTSSIRSPLEGTVRFALSFNLGDKEYEEL